MLVNEPRKIKLAIDARFYGPLGKGLGRYTQEIVDNIIKISQADESNPFEFIIFLSADNFDEFVSNDPAVRKVRLNFRWYSLAEQIFFPWRLIREKVDLVHFPHFNVPLLTTKPFIVTIHDLILTRFPTRRASTLSPAMYFLKNLAYRLVIFTAIKRARQIISVSQFTKNDIVQKFGVKESKITVTYEGVANLSHGHDSLFVAKMADQEVLSKYNINHQFLLYVGNAYPHKNLESLIRTFIEIRKEKPDLRLVLVGKDDYFYKRIKEYAASHNLWQVSNINSPVIFPGYVPDRQLEIMYQRAAAYVFPSFYEGFGLPPLEAMAKGCPVLCSNQSSLPEVLGEAALYFDPYQESDFVAKAKLILDNQGLRQSLVEKGYQQAKLYNWWECARETLDVYKRSLRIS